MATHVRITYSRKRRLPLDFHDDDDDGGSGVVSPSPPFMCASVDGDPSSSPQPSSPPSQHRTPLGERPSNPIVPRRFFSAGTKPSPGGGCSRSLAAKKPRLTQLTIDLGGDPHRKCKVCGMEYIHTNAEDVALHKRFHGSCLEGLEVPRGLMEKVKVVWRGGLGKGVKRADVRKAGKRDKVGAGFGMVVEVDRRGGLAVRNFARKVLRIAEKELGAVEIEERDLWGPVRVDLHDKAEERTLSDPLPMTTATATGTARLDAMGRSDAKSDRYKVYLYVQDGRCIGLCLGERIREALKVLGNHNPGEIYTSSSIATEPDSVVSGTLGISRIWVSREQRGIGVATALVDATREHFLSGAVVVKETVAWSQPTESGAKFARRYFGKEHGWLVYNEQFWGDRIQQN